MNNLIILMLINANFITQNIGVPQLELWVWIWLMLNYTSDVFNQPRAYCKRHNIQDLTQERRQFILGGLPLDSAFPGRGRKLPF